MSNKSRLKSLSARREKRKAGVESSSRSSHWMKHDYAMRISISQILYVVGTIVFCVGISLSKAASQRHSHGSCQGNNLAAGRLLLSSTYYTTRTSKGIFQRRDSELAAQTKTEGLSTLHFLLLLPFSRQETRTEMCVGNLKAATTATN